MHEIDPTKAPEALNDLAHLASGIGHHVINAFSAIVSNAEILRMGNNLPNPVAPEVLADMIISTAMEAASVARRLIDYTRPITNIGDDRLDLDRLVAEYVDARRASGPADVTWSTTLGPVPPIRGHDGYLRAMLDQFVANAIEARGPSPLEVSFSTSVDTRGWVVLEIRDSGLGIEPGVLERAVEPFFSTRPGHLGVGLSIANGIWRRHKGTLSLRSVPGDGTLVRLCVEPFEGL